MTQAILIILGVVIIVILLSRKSREAAVGICSSVLDQTARKNTNKEKALEFLRARRSLDKGGAPQSEASNEDIREHLGVSRRSVVRYLDELEKEGKVEQVGDIGRGVVYRPKQ